jgi:hypothetical protein
MDGYTHLYIDNLRPYVALLDEEVNAARGELAAEKCARKTVEQLRSNTFTTQNTGTDRHTVA